MTDLSYYSRCHASYATLAQNWEGDAWQSRRNDVLDLADQGDHSRNHTGNPLKRWR